MPSQMRIITNLYLSSCLIESFRFTISIILITFEIMMNQLFQNIYWIIHFLFNQYICWKQRLIVQLHVYIFNKWLNINHNQKKNFNNNSFDALLSDYFIILYIECNYRPFYRSYFLVEKLFSIMLFLETKKQLDRFY